MSGQAVLMETGWVPVEFDVPVSDRDEFARLGNTLLDFALIDERVRLAFSATLDPSLVCDNNPTMYGFSEAINSKDAKWWGHFGYQTASIIEHNDPSVAQTAEVSDFMQVLPDVLRMLSDACREGIQQTLGETSLTDILLPDNEMDRITHLRLVRYLRLGSFPVGHEVIEPHTDLGVVTVPWYETDLNFLKGAAFDPSFLTWDWDDEAKAHARMCESIMKPVEYDEYSKAAFCYGAGIAGLDHRALSTGITELPYALYHGGYRPPEEQMIKRSGGWLDDDVRLAMIGFFHPNRHVIGSPNYRIPLVQTCRPLYKEKRAEI